MGAEVQSKTYFPGSMTDLNTSFPNGALYLYHNDKTQNISGPTNSQHYDYFPTMAAADGYSGYAKEQIRQTIVKQDSIFRHQIQELHRVYKRQRDLTNPVSAETLMFSSGFPVVDPSFSRVSTPTTNYTFSPLNKGKSTLNGFGPGVSERIVIDLEQPADVDESNRRKQKVGSFHSLKTEKRFNLADLNKPVKMEEREREMTFSSFFGNQNRTRSFAEEPQKRDSSAKRTIFGFEIDERNHTPNFQSLPWKNATSVQNGPRLHQNHRINSSDLRNYNPGFFAGHPNMMTNSTSRLSNSAFGFLNESKDSVSDNLEEMRAREKHRFLDMWKNQKTPEQKTLPPWLTAKPCLPNVQNKAKETSVHHINLDSLQNHSQRFFKMADANDTHVFKKVKTDDSRNVTKLLGVPISDPKVEKKESVSETRRYIDLNMSYDEEEAAPSFPESVVKIATMEIDLEAPAVLESDSDDGSNDIHMELVKVAAEAIVSISISQPPSEPSADTLLWFADVITSNDCKDSLLRADKEYVPEGMDYFEYMTLKLKDTEEKHDVFKPMIAEEQKEDDTSSLSKRTPRKGQGKRGRPKRDFQRDVLPSMVSLSRREVTEDLQIFEEAFSSTGVSWQSSMSKRKAARNSRGKRLVPAAKAGGEKKTICKELSLEKSLEGWGRRTRRLPRQRCQNGGNHQSLALKC